MKQDIIEKLNQYITSRVLRDPARILSPDEPLISGGIIDSFNLVDLAIFTEDEFGVHLDDMELNVEHFDSLNQLAELIQSRLG
ncbi:MAG: acyl carrier protein [Anaerolineaceae bacterium]|jgi:acyl carrier protein